MTKPTDTGERQTRVRHVLAAGELPPGDAVLRIDYGSLSERLERVAPELDAVLPLVDGKRTVREILEGSTVEPEDLARALRRLLDESVVRVGAPSGPTPPPLPGLAIALPPDALPPPLPHAPRIVRYDRRGSGGARAATPIPKAILLSAGRGAVGTPPPTAASQLRAHSRPRAGGDPASLAHDDLTPAAIGTGAPPRRRSRLPALVAVAVLGAIGAVALVLVMARAPRAAPRPPRSDVVPEAPPLATRLDDLRRAIDLDPAQAAPYIALARELMDQRRVDEARLAYARYLALDPQGPHAVEARAALGSEPVR